MAKSDEFIEMDGTVVEQLPSTTFRVELENGQLVLATLSGRMRKHRIRVSMGDLVSLQISPYDTTRGRIHRRHNAQKPSSNQIPQ